MIAHTSFTSRFGSIISSPWLINSWKARFIPIELSPGDEVYKGTPTAAALFPKEYLEWAPRSYVERIYNIKRWTQMPKGGHFAALEQPGLLVKDIRDFAKSL